MHRMAVKSSHPLCLVMHPGGVKLRGRIGSGGKNVGQVMEGSAVAGGEGGKGRGR